MTAKEIENFIILMVLKEYLNEYDQEIECINCNCDKEDLEELPDGTILL